MHILVKKSNVFLKKVNLDAVVTISNQVFNDQFHKEVTWVKQRLSISNFHNSKFPPSFSMKSDFKHIEKICTWNLQEVI